MDKVYCEDCKYFNRIHFSNLYFLPDYCHPPVEVKEDFSWLDGSKRYGGQDYKKLNKDNNCPYCKRKWWKFWR